jgi:hypothetical protein
VPHGRTNGDYLKIKVDNKDTTIQIPSVAKLGRKILPGERFEAEIILNLDKIFVSTLPMIPGMEILQSKPIIWTCFYTIIYSTA